MVSFKSPPVATRLLVLTATIVARLLVFKATLELGKDRQGNIKCYKPTCPLRVGAGETKKNCPRSNDDLGITRPRLVMHGI